VRAKQHTTHLTCFACLVLGSLTAKSHVIGLQ